MLKTLPLFLAYRVVSASQVNIKFNEYCQLQITSALEPKMADQLETPAGLEFIYYMQRSHGCANAILRTLVTAHSSLYRIVT